MEILFRLISSTSTLFASIAYLVLLSEAMENRYLRLQLDLRLKNGLSMCCVLTYMLTFYNVTVYYVINSLIRLLIRGLLILPQQLMLL